jgi:hypothetical protein
MRAARTRSPRFACLASFAAITLLVAAGPADALEWDGSRAQDVTAKAVDLTLIRPVASIRVLVGGLLFVPAALIASPMGKEGIDGAMDVLVTAPAEYAFDREIGQF